MKKSSAPKLNNRGFSIVEILVAVALFAIIVTSVSFFAVDVYRFNASIDKRVEASLYEQEVRNAIILIKTDRWSDIMNHADGSSHHAVLVDGKYEIVSGTEQRDGITVGFSIGSVYRDLSGQIVEVGGAEDVHTKVVTIDTSWTDITGLPKNLTSKLYINDWNLLRWSQTTDGEFGSGAFDFTRITNITGGEIQLQYVKYSDWCRPNLSLTAYDMPGQGIAKGIYAIPGNAVMGTGQNASGMSLINALIDDSDPPNVTVPGTVNGYKTNDVFVTPGYGLITTDTNSSEVVILNLSSVPYIRSGYFDAPGVTDGDSVFVSGTTGYMTAGNHFYAFDLTSMNGSRPILGNHVDLVGTGKSIVVSGNFAYVATVSTTTQMQVIDISNVNFMHIVGQANLNASYGVDVFVDSALNRAYLATANSSDKSELFVLDIQKFLMTGSVMISAIGTYDTGSMNPTGIVTVTDGRAIIVGSSGQEYQVIDILDELHPFQCGGLEVDTGINGVASLTTASGAAYSYIITGDSADELKIIKGGLGGGNEFGDGFASSGMFVSSIFDTQSATTQYYYIDWNETLVTGTDLTVQIRTGNNTDLSDGVWMGPDGTDATFFTEAGGTSIPDQAQNKRYVQYRVFFTSDTVNTPVLNNIAINYQPG